MTCDKNEMESVYCKPGIFALSKYLPMRNLKIGFFFSFIVIPSHRELFS